MYDGLEEQEYRKPDYFWSKVVDHENGPIHLSRYQYRVRLDKTSTQEENLKSIAKADTVDMAYYVMSSTIIVYFKTYDDFCAFYMLYGSKMQFRHNVIDKLLNVTK